VKNFILALLLSLTCAMGNNITIQHNAKKLVNGSQAINVTLSNTGKSAIPDLRKSPLPVTSEIVSDIIDLNDTNNTGIADEIIITEILMTAESAIDKSKSTIKLCLRSGNSYFTQSGWSEWLCSEKLTLKEKKPGGRYIQYRILLTAQNSETLPSVSSININAAYKLKNKPFKNQLQINSFHNEKYIQSAVPFTFEKPFYEPYAELIRKLGYDTVWYKGKNEIERFVSLNAAVARTPNPDHSGWDDYPFDARKICSYVDTTMTIKGHCMSYAAVLVAAFTSFGKYARHWAVNGFRNADHEVVEVWSDSLRKWIYLDPSLSQYYLDSKTKIPMSILEQHNTYVNLILKDGETLSDFSVDSLKERMKAIGGGKIASILCIDSGWHYGKQVDPATYDWGWYHSYLADGFMRLTTRTNFASQPEPSFKSFGAGLKDNIFMQWVDSKTPPKTKDITLFTERERDLWPTLNQAFFKATRTGEDVIELELGNSQPFFNHYLISINGKTERLTTSSYTWKLAKGENVFKIVPVDENKRNGIASLISVIY